MPRPNSRPKNTTKLTQFLVGGFIHGRGVCVVKGACMAKGGGMHGKGGMCDEGGMHSCLVRIL